jgi:hypothetical protein
MNLFGFPMPMLAFPLPRLLILRKRMIGSTFSWMSFQMSVLATWMTWKPIWIKADFKISPEKGV